MSREAGGAIWCALAAFALIIVGLPYAAMPVAVLSVDDNRRYRIRQRERR